ncbi:MAG: stage V sporulation protein AC [Oscillospiraceae bacterium]|nr:stage V sporulation protein AC [Oscillospiraceae bacterium]
MTKQQYDRYIRQMEPKSPLWKDVCFAFLIGGAICALAQLIQNGWGMLGLDKTDAGAATSVSMIFLGALLTGLSVFDDIAKVAGAGTLVPITGFANSIVAPAMEFRSEGLITGMAAKMFTVAGPVIVFGVSASVLYGVILCIVQAL